MALGVSGALGSLAFFSSLFDPFSAAKTFVIISLASGILGYGIVDLLSSKSKRLIGPKSYLIGLALIFVASFLFRTLTSNDVNLALHGVVGRNSGFLTYFAYGILFIFAVAFIHSSNFFLVINSLLATGFVAGSYSLLEYLKLNPWKINDVYLGTSGLFGNPNFSGAFLSITSVASVWAWINAHKKNHKVFSIIVFALSIFGVYTSKALQGYISIALGSSVLFLVWLFNRNKKLAALGLSVFSLGGLVAILGTLQLGPLSTFLYKGSVSERGDMWRTAISMIKDKPLFGVGIERYGINFRQYRDINQVLRTGPDSFSDNAHNVLLHLTATGGIFLGLTYLTLTIAIFYVGVRGIVRGKSAQQTALVFAMAVWIPIQAQNAISVDTPGVFIWSWILGGAIVAIAFEKPDEAGEGKKISKKSTIHPLAPAVALICVLASFSLTIKPLIAQRSFNFAFHLGVDEKVPETLKAKVEYLINSENQDAGNVTWPRYSANSLYIDKAWKETIAAAQRAIEKDPEDWVSWWFMASAYEESGDRAAAIPARSKTVELDPLNTSVLLDLAKDQLAASDKDGFEKSKARILAINPDSNDAKTVLTL
jgi:O-antigen ligase